MYTNKKKPTVPRYPNAADRQYFINKFLESLLIIVTGIGTFVTLAFLFLM